MEKYAYLVKKYEKGNCIPYYFSSQDKMIRFAFNALKKNSYCFLDIYSFNDFLARGGRMFWKYVGTVGNVKDGKYNGISKNKSSRTRNINLPSYIFTTMRKNKTGKKYRYYAFQIKRNGKATRKYFKSLNDAIKYKDEWFKENENR